MDVLALREQFPTLRAEEPLTYLDNACVYETLDMGIF